MLMTKYAGSAFIKVANLAKGPQHKTIEGIDEGQYGRPVITFADGKRLSVNVTNTNTGRAYSNPMMDMYPND